MARILCIGDAMVDVVAQIDGAINFGSDTSSRISMHGGGAASNTACWLGWLGEDVTFAGRIGDDTAGRVILEDFHRFEVKYENLIIPGERSGIVIVLVDKDGERTMFPDPAANSGLDLGSIPQLDDFDAIFLSGYSLYNPRSTEGVIRIIEAAHNQKIPIYFDLASVGTMEQFGKEKILKHLPSFAGLFMNEAEAHFITGKSEIDAIINDLSRLTSLVIVKRGARGAIAYSERSGLIEIAGTPTAVVDTTGAGDAFAAGFLSIYVTNGDLNGALTRADEVARKCVGIIGARPASNP